MSHISTRPEQSTSAEIEALTNLAALDVSGANEFIQKTGATSFANGTPSGVGAGAFNVETPSGAINGANKSYTVSGTITTILVLAINGEFIHPIEYTASSGGFEMATALPASLSGTSFTIVYV